MTLTKIIINFESAHPEVKPLAETLYTLPTLGHHTFSFVVMWQ